MFHKQTQQYNNHSNKLDCDKIDHNKDYNLVFNELQDYMLTNEFIYKFSNKCEINKKVVDKKESTETLVKYVNKIKNDFISPIEKDKLFWCFYILQNGLENYEFIKTIVYKTEQEFKYKTAEKIKEHKNTFKSLKLKICELQDELINQPCITIKGLIALCHIYNINLLYVKNRTYYEIIVNDTNNQNIILDMKDKTGKHLIHIPSVVTDEMIKSYKDNYWKIDNPNNCNNPLKSISSYTLVELQNICNCLSIQSQKDKKITKKELYEIILQNIQ
jgi:hypothetical protein